jgi:hypothetical protein
MTLRHAVLATAALALILTTFPAAPAVAWAAGPRAASQPDSAPPASRFRVIPLHPREPAHPHRAAYTLIAAGLALTGASFVLEDRAQRTYDDYLAATETRRITELYDRTAHYDRLSSGALVGGQVLIGAGIWTRFIHHTSPARLALAVTPRRCALLVSF